MPASDDSRSVFQDASREGGWGPGGELGPTAAKPADDGFSNVPEQSKKSVRSDL